MITPQETEFWEAAERHRLYIQEFWARVNIHMLLQTGLVGAFALLAAQDGRVHSDVLSIVAAAGLAMSFIGAIIITRSLYLMRCWEDATRRAEHALQLNDYQDALRSFNQKIRHHPERPEDFFIVRLGISSSLSAALLQWLFTIAWPLLFLYVVRGVHPMIPVAKVFLVADSVLVVGYIVAFVMMKVRKRLPLNVKDTVERSLDILTVVPTVVTARRPRSRPRPIMPAQVQANKSGRRVEVTIDVADLLVDETPHTRQTAVKEVVFTAHQAMWLSSLAEALQDREVGVVVLGQMRDGNGTSSRREFGEAYLTAVAAGQISPHDWSQLNPSTAWERYSYTRLAGAVVSATQRRPR